MNDTLGIETEGPDGMPFDLMLLAIHSRPDEDVETARRWWNNMGPKAVSINETVRKFAALGWTTVKIWRHVDNFYPPGFKVPDMALELMALMVEAEVRRYWKSHVGKR